MTIEIEIGDEKVSRKLQTVLKKETKKFFLDKKVNSEMVVSFHFVSKNKIKTLNKKYRYLDKPTDVLSFPIWQNLPAIPQNGAVNLGDIFITLGEVKKNALKSKVKIEDELARIVEHSLNHLIGKHH